MVENSFARSVCLHYRGEDEAYSSEKSEDVSIAAGAKETDICFSVPCTNPPVTAIKVVFTAGADGPYCVKFFSLKIENDSMGVRDELLNIASAQDLIAKTSLSGIDVHHGCLGDILTLEGKEPNVEVFLQAPLSQASTLTVELCIDCLFGDEFVLARDLFILSHEKLERELRVTKDEVERLRIGLQRLDAYERSRVWPLFLWLYRYNRRFSLLRQTPFHRWFPDLFRSRGESVETKYEKWLTANGYEDSGDGDR